MLIITDYSGFDPSVNNTKNIAENSSLGMEQGYMVRTRADADTKEARKNDYSRFEAAIESGAQVITTDYYLPDEKLGNDYHISFHDTIKERINPLLKQR